MRPGRELDTAIAKEVMGHNVKVKQKGLWEEAPKGERPLRNYSKDISAAWEVVEKMDITLIPIEDGKWFALAGIGRRWKSPADFIEYLKAGNFVEAGAAVGESVALTVCIAAIKAIKAIEHQRSKQADPDLNADSESPTTQH